MLSLLTLMWCVGQIFRDVTWMTGLCFYIPSPAIAAVWLFFAIVALRCKRRGLAVAALVILVLPLAMMGVRENAILRTPTRVGGSPSLRFVHWNVYRGHLGWEAIQQRLADERADFYLLSEIPRDASFERLTTLRPDVTDATSIRIGIMAVWGLGQIDDLGWVWKSREAKVRRLRWHSPQGLVTILAVDLVSDPLVHRTPVLTRLNALIEHYQPDIIAGDFNAPRESLALSQLPQGYRHAYWTVGSGWSYTWPMPLPVFALDQCLFGERITPMDYRIKSSRLSDHRLGVFEFVVGRMR